MTDHNAEGRQDGGLNPQALRLADMARVLSASGPHAVTAKCCRPTSPPVPRRTRTEQ